MRERHGELFTKAQRFLDSATYGLPSQRQTQVLHDALDDWSAGTMDASVFDETVDAARRGFASLVGVSPSAVAIGSAASGLVGLVPASLPDGSRVAVQHGEFTSVTAPLAVQSDRGVEVHQVEPGELADRAHAFDLVAVSVVQSSDGRVLDLERLRTLTPHAAGWYSSETPWTNTYAHPPQLAADARRFDLSPAWHPMLGAGIALPWLADLDMRAIERHCTNLADRVREAAGRLHTVRARPPPAGSPRGMRIRRRRRRAPVRPRRLGRISVRRHCRPESTRRRRRLKGRREHEHAADDRLHRCG